MTAHKLSTYSYGKDDVRILRVVRSPQDASSHQIIEYSAQCLLSGSSLLTSYTEADNSKVVPTDTIKNTLNLLAKKASTEEILCPEKFALVIVNHFLSRYDHITNAHVELKQFKWSRIVLDKSGPHKHSFVKDGNEIRTVKAFGSKNSNGKPVVAEIKGGIVDLVVLKSSGSAFYGFWRDENTTLKAVQDRIFSTSVECEYTIKMPSEPLTDLLASPSKLPPFNDIFKAATSHILTTFCTHSSPYASWMMPLPVQSSRLN
jgi:urate oxidase